MGVGLGVQVFVRCSPKGCGSTIEGRKIAVSATGSRSSAVTILAMNIIERPENKAHTRRAQE